MSSLLTRNSRRHNKPDQATPVDIPNKAPDMVCFGEGPNWSVQLQQGRARRLGINQPDSFYNGKFVWVPNENVWNWTGDNTNGQGDHLVVTINKKACVDNQRKQQFPYSAQTMLRPATSFSAAAAS